MISFYSNTSFMVSKPQSGVSSIINIEQMYLQCQGSSVADLTEIVPEKDARTRGERAGSEQGGADDPRE